MNCNTTVLEKIDNNYILICSNCHHQYKSPTINYIANCKAKKFDKVKIFAESTRKHIQNKRKFVNKKVQKVRTEICNEPCIFNIKDICTLCGCGLKGKVINKIKWESESCPVEKWPKINMDCPFVTLKGKELSILENVYNGASGFFIGCGPSLANCNLNHLQERGILTLAVNNIAAINIHPNIWCSVDSTKKFCENIWFDPTIMKFIPYPHSQTVIGNTKIRAKDCPNVFYFQMNNHFNHKTFLTERTVNWGCKKGVMGSDGTKSGRSVMLIAIRIAYFLGIRKLYLIGCDFNMKEKQPYAFEQTKHAGGCSSNNDCYRIMNSRLASLRPVLEKAGMNIYNSTPNSKLEAFDYVPYEDAMEDILKRFPQKVKTEGMYDKK